MGAGLITVHKSGYGRVWSNTYGLLVNTTAGRVDQAQLTTAYDAIAQPVTADSTNPASGDYAGSPDWLTALLAFERLLHFDTVNFDSVVVNDGTTPGTPTGPFFSIPLGFPGLRHLGGGLIAPLNITALIDRVPTTVGVRVGHIWYRGAILAPETAPGTRDGVTWASSGDKTAYQALIDDSIIASNFSAYFGPPSTPDTPITIGYLEYATVPGTPSKVIDGGHPCNAYRANSPQSRQLPRGRKRS
jgi:hypothetical protein